MVQLIRPAGDRDVAQTALEPRQRDSDRIGRLKSRRSPRSICGPRALILRAIYSARLPFRNLSTEVIGAAPLLAVCFIELQGVQLAGHRRSHADTYPKSRQVGKTRILQRLINGNQGKAEGPPAFQIIFSRETLHFKNRRFQDRGEKRHRPRVPLSPARRTEASRQRHCLRRI